MTRPRTITAGAPTQLGRYEILTELAAGGMATVYLARAVGVAGFDRLFAIKCIHSDLADSRDFVEMFLDEARLTSALSHPNTCSVVEVGIDDGVHFLAMEYLHGQPLSRLCAKWFAGSNTDHGLWAQASARILADACEGLHAAHELRDAAGRRLDVVHRDVSPQNLFVTYDGAVKVVDFGIARAVGRLHETSADALKGKIAYMSPEYIRNAASDRRIDLWAVGVVLHELVSGRRLFRRANQFATIQAILEHEVPSVDALDARFAGLDAILARALVRDVDSRYRTARELAKDLNRWAASHAEPFGMGELAELMHQMFGAERAEADARIERARRGEAPPPGSLPRATHSGSFTRRAAPSSDLDGPTDKSVSLPPANEERTGVARRRVAATIADNADGPPDFLDFVTQDSAPSPIEAAADEGAPTADAHAEAASVPPAPSAAVQPTADLATPRVTEEAGAGLDRATGAPAWVWIAIALITGVLVTVLVALSVVFVARGARDDRRPLMETPAATP